jgi:hypothetical protein
MESETRQDEPRPERSAQRITEGVGVGSCPTTGTIAAVDVTSIAHPK